MPKGVFNPYKKPKKNFQAPTGKNPLDTEPMKSETDIRLDGDSFIIEFKNIEIDDVAATLSALISDVMVEHKEHLNQEGVKFAPKGQKMDAEEGELILLTSKGNLCVYVGEKGTEIDAFRRIGYALHILPIQEILESYQARVIARG